VDLDDGTAFVLVMAAASGHLDVEEIAERLAVRPICGSRPRAAPRA